MAGNQATFLSYRRESLKDQDLRLWGTGLPDAPENLFKQASFALLPEEAGFLHDHIAGSAKAGLLNEPASKQKNFSEDWAGRVHQDTVSVHGDARIASRQRQYVIGVAADHDSGRILGAQGL